MAEREWKPGAVAMVTDPTGDVRPMIHIGHDPANSCWHGAGSDGDLRCLDAGQALDVRPLVVIDPEDSAQVTQLGPILAKWGYSFEGTPLRFNAGQDGSCLAAALREFANPAPPKPAEPTGLGAVVVDADGRHFVRQADGWWRGDEPCSLNWAAVDAVRVLSEGVTP